MGYRYHYQDDRTIKNFISWINNFPFKMKIDDTILRKHNDVCPMCRQPMKIRNGEIQNFGEIGYWILKDRPNYAFLYCLCKSCKRSLNKKMAAYPDTLSYMLSKSNDPREQAIEQYITEKFKPRVLRKHNTDLLPMLSYHEEIYEMMHVEFEESGLAEFGFDLVETYLLHFNGTCPVCREEIPTEDDERMDVSRVFIMEEGHSKVAVAFCLCFNCSENVEHQQVTNLEDEPESLRKAMEVVSAVVFEPL
jgi:hypothetical protein